MDSPNTPAHLSEPKSVLVMLTLDDDMLLINVPDKPPRRVRDLAHLHEILRDPTLKAAKTMPTQSIGDVLGGILRAVSNVGSGETPSE